MSKPLLISLACASLILGCVIGYYTFSSPSYDGSFLGDTVLFSSFAMSAQMFAHILTKSILASKYNIPSPLVNRGSVELEEWLLPVVPEFIGNNTPRFNTTRSLLFVGLSILFLFTFYQGEQFYKNKVLRDCGQVQEVVVNPPFKSGKGFLITRIQYAAGGEVWEKELLLGKLEEGDTAEILFVSCNPRISIWKADLEK